ncbi:MAG: hypothetical protein GEU82_00290 [Luteitalea sp.]|nr:hypothetical protein [Luteitalea sp.]
MPDRIGKIAGRVALAACLIFALVPVAVAQQPLPDPPLAPEFMSRFDFHLTAAGLSHEDQRFSIDTHWGGDFDLVDYVVGRATFLVDYQALLGHEFRPFDPYQSNYLLEAAGSVRLGKTEIYAVLNHVSRHLGDRFKRNPVAENSLGPRVMRRFATGRTTIDLRGDARKVIARSFMDYDWIGVAEVSVRRSLNGRASVYGRGVAETYLIDKTIAGRDRQDGGRVEAGVRLHGARGGFDLFAGYERVVDADPLDRTARRWAFAGFRLVGH